MEVKKYLFFIMIIIIVNISYIHAEEFGYNLLDVPINQTTTIFINGSGLGGGNWTTSSFGNLSDANSAQFVSNDGVLSLKESWITSFINAWFATKTTDDLTEGSTNLYDNQSWNESWANNLYNETIYTIYFTSSNKNIIIYNLTNSDASIITVETVPGQKEIYGGDFE